MRLAAVVPVLLPYMSPRQSDSLGTSPFTLPAMPHRIASQASDAALGNQNVVKVNLPTKGSVLRRLKEQVQSPQQYSLAKPLLHLTLNFVRNWIALQRRASHQIATQNTSDLPPDLPKSIGTQHNSMGVKSAYYTASPTSAGPSSA